MSFTKLAPFSDLGKEAMIMLLLTMKPLKKCRNKEMKQ